MMSQPKPTEGNGSPPVPANAARQHIRFVEQAADGETVLMEFVDPNPSKAVLVAAGPETLPQAPVNDPGAAIDILSVPGHARDHPSTLEEMTQWVLAGNLPGTAPPITITLHGTHVVWRPGRAAILAPSDRLEALVLALVDFSYYERELHKLERATADSWPQLEADTPLAFEVTARDLERQEGVRRQVQRLLTVRLRHARIAPRLVRPGSQLSSLANQLGERLRDKARMEDRLETLGSQLEVFERVYEMSSQRFSEFRTARQDQTLEWVIIVLLAAETVLLLIEVILSLERH
jgi:hypothetical protein